MFASGVKELSHKGRLKQLVSLRERDLRMDGKASEASRIG
jgi:hypothetical protein